MKNNNLRYFWKILRINYKYNATNFYKNDADNLGLLFKIISMLHIPL